MKPSQRPILVVLTILLSTGLLNACQFAGGESIKGDGSVTNRSYTVKSFSTLELHGAYNVSLASGAEPSVSIDTDENMHELILVESDGKVLKISSKRESVLRPTRMDLHIVYSGSLEKISVIGACKLSAHDKLVSERLHLNLSGASDLHLDLELESLLTNVSGAGNIHLRGLAANHRAELSGASNLRAEDLITKTTRISLSGAGSAQVYATEHLDASISGVGKIEYAGNPKEKSINTSGIGTIRSVQ